MTHDREEGKKGNSKGNNVNPAKGLDVTPQRNDGLSDEDKVQKLRDLLIYGQHFTLDGKRISPLDVYAKAD
jgi:hypothetical protein